MLKYLILTTLFLLACITGTFAQKKTPDAKTGQNPPASKKINQRPAVEKSDPFDKATVEKMAAQCVKLETEAGVIELELFPESAPETVRSFLNLTATGLFNTTKFSRIVPNFVVQGGNLSTRETITPEISTRARKTLPDEPSAIKHERGIVSMARPDEPNSATTHFFILVNDAKHLDGTFTAFGRVIQGMEVVDEINKMPVDGDKPVKPVRLTRAIIEPCPVKTPAAN